jgi:hypothetical protein
VEVAPSATVSGKEYRFKQWGTGETDNSRAVALDTDKSLTVVYEEVRPPEPSGGIPVPALFVAAGLASALLLAGRARRR